VTAQNTIGSRVRNDTNTTSDNNKYMDVANAVQPEGAGARVLGLLQQRLLIQQAPTQSTRGLLEYYSMRDGAIGRSS